AVRLDGRAGLEADLEQPLEIDRVRRAVLDDTSLRMTDRAHRWMARRLGHPECELLARLPLPRMHRRLHPLELGEDVVRKIEAAVVQDVALGPSQDAERSEHCVRLLD